MHIIRTLEYVQKVTKMDKTSDILSSILTDVMDQNFALKEENAKLKNEILKLKSDHYYQMTLELKIRCSSLMKKRAIDQAQLGAIKNQNKSLQLELSQQDQKLMDLSSEIDDLKNKIGKGADFEDVREPSQIYENINVPSGDEEKIGKGKGCIVCPIHLYAGNCFDVCPFRLNARNCKCNRCERTRLEQNTGTRRTNPTQTYKKA